MLQYLALASADAVVGLAHRGLEGLLAPLQPHPRGAGAGGGMGRVEAHLLQGVQAGEGGGGGGVGAHLLQEAQAGLRRATDRRSGAGGKRGDSGGTEVLLKRYWWSVYFSRCSRHACTAEIE
jgi:hypothetical protein